MTAATRWIRKRRVRSFGHERERYYNSVRGRESRPEYLNLVTERAKPAWKQFA